MTLYHLSASYLGVQVRLTPRLPRDRMIGENHTVRRISVAPTVNGCKRALAMTYYRGAKWFVYRALEPAEHVDPMHVPDARLTGERWLLKPGWFVYADTVPASL